VGRRVAAKSTPPASVSASAGPTLADATVAVTAQWRADRLISDQTLLRATETIGRYVRRLERTGVQRFGQEGPAEAAAFVLARTRDGSLPELATMHARRTCLRMLYRSLRSLGWHDGDPTLDLILPPRGALAARPLTGDEAALCRVSSRMGVGARTLRLAVCWALGETTAVSSEISSLRVRDLDDQHRPEAVRLPGTRRHDPRVGRLTPWGRTVLGRHLEALHASGAGPDTLLAYRGAATPGGHVGQASVCNALGAVLDLAGLSAESDVRPASLRHWAGRELFDAGAPIEEVARRLGARSLDSAAEDIALAWREAR
jgi:site-specific recombinase XerD